MRGQNENLQETLYAIWLSIKLPPEKEEHLTGHHPDHAIMTEDSAEHKKSLAQLAFYDALTGLPNRTFFRETGFDALLSRQDSQSHVWLLQVSLDDFKKINTRHGEAVGDALLSIFADRLRAIAPQRSIARISGNEFALLVTDNADRQYIEDLATVILNEAIRPFTVGDNDISLTAFIGIANFPDDANDFVKLWRYASTAAILAEKDARQHICFFTAEMGQKMIRESRIATDISSALKAGQFYLVYQPLMALQTGDIVGFEALIRWDHPHLDPNTDPSEFIPIAEERADIISIGHWVLKEAARQLREWHDLGYGNVFVAVNLSAVQFKQIGLADSIMKVIDKFGLPPQSLHIELTESAAMDDPVIAEDVIKKLTRRGICMSIDDFGTGYSSLSRLKDFHPYSLKIDKSFIRDLSNHSGRAVTEALLGLAESLDMKTVAEGVESAEHIPFLRDRNCTEIQGYFISKPLRAEEVPVFLAEQEWKVRLSEAGIRFDLEPKQPQKNHAKKAEKHAFSAFSNAAQNRQNRSTVP